MNLKRKLRNLKKHEILGICVIISLLIHAVPVALISQSKEQGGGGETSRRFKGKGEEGNGGGDKKLKGNAVEVEIIVPKSTPVASSISEPKKPKKGFWGIGILEGSISLPERGIFYAEEVGELYYGYPAKEAGLMVGDIIFLVNGRPLTIEPIRGDKPKHLTLTILRGGKVITIQLDRGFIELK